MFIHTLVKSAHVFAQEFGNLAHVLVKSDRKHTCFVVKNSAQFGQEFVPKAVQNGGTFVHLKRDHVLHLATTPPF